MRLQRSASQNDEKGDVAISQDIKTLRNVGLFYLTPKVRPSPPVLEVRLQALEKEHFSQQGAAKVNLIPSTVVTKG